MRIAFFFININVKLKCIQVFLICATGHIWQSLSTTQAPEPFMIYLIINKFLCESLTIAWKSKCIEKLAGIKEFCEKNCT